MSLSSVRVRRLSLSLFIQLSHGSSIYKGYVHVDGKIDASVQGVSVVGDANS